MSSVISKYPQGRGPHATFTRDTLDLTVQGPSSPGSSPADMAPQHIWTPSCGLLHIGTHWTYIDKLKFVHYEADTVGKRAMGILLECFLVLTFNFQNTCSLGFWVGLWSRRSCYWDQSRLYINEDFQKHYYLIDLNIIGHCRNKSVTNCPVSWIWFENYTGWYGFSNLTFQFCV